MLLTILVFIAILSLLVLIHEFGHFLVAKKSNIKVEEFGFGLPPRIWGKKIGETLYSVNLLPIGGFVKLFGEDAEQLADSQRSFANKPLLTRMSVVVAGVVSNFLLSILLLTIALTIGVYIWTSQVSITQVTSNSPAMQAGLTKGDIIYSIDGKNVTNSTEFISYVNDHKDQKINLDILRGRQTVGIAVTPRMSPPPGEGPLGVAVSNFAIRSYPVWIAPIEGIKEAWQITTLTISSLLQLAARALTTGSVPGDAIAGPVGIANLTGQAVNIGFAAVVYFAAILSLNLAIVNILPFPALDGGRFAFLILEGVFRRKVAVRIEKYIHAVGLAILITLILVITANDISRLIK